MIFIGSVKSLGRMVIKVFESVRVAGRYFPAGIPAYPWQEAGISLALHAPRMRSAAATCPTYK